MAQSGGQPGNQNATKNRPWAQAIQRALRKRSKSDQIEALDELAEKFLNSVEEGNVADFKELGDRLDGKPSQQVVHAGDSDNPVRIEKIVREVVKP